MFTGEFSPTPAIPLRDLCDLCAMLSSPDGFLT
jgi:hypothetical protein